MNQDRQEMDVNKNNKFNFVVQTSDFWKLEKFQFVSTVPNLSVVWPAWQTFGRISRGDKFVSIGINIILKFSAVNLSNEIVLKEIQRKKIILRKTKINNFVDLRREQNNSKTKSVVEKKKLRKSKLEAEDQFKSNRFFVEIK